MRIHIVCRKMFIDIDEAGILRRLAETLADGTGWTLSENPDQGADLNYFSCYIEYAEKFTDWHLTPVAAWFTHYEEGTPFKEFWWDLATEQVDLRVTSAPMYAEMLSRYGPTELVRPAVSPAFDIQPSDNEGRKPRVGVSGFVHPGERKGAVMVAKLAASLGERIDFVGSGQGWPVHTEERLVSELPEFYQSLDVLLCTSTIEGIPMPPLEALACGVQVVIPRHVGLLDDLPDVPGIHRYAAGNYPAMRLCVEAACFGDVVVDKEALRNAVAQYSPENWCADHQKAFENHLYNVVPVQRESDRHGGLGVLYVAYGDPARKCAKAAMKTFKRFHDSCVEIALVSDAPIGVEDIFIECDDVDVGGRHAKTRIYDIAPAHWEYVMYLDADTEVVGRGDYLFRLLHDGWDMVICKNPGKYHIASQMVRSDNLDECEHTFDLLGTDELLQLNGGVFAFQRNERTGHFFHAWHEEWKRWGKRDQGALLRALFANPIKLFVLGNEWNTITRYDPKEKAAFVLHYPMSARRWRGKIQGRSDGKEAWQAVNRFKATASE